MHAIPVETAVRRGRAAERATRPRTPKKRRPSWTGRLHRKRIIGLADEVRESKNKNCRDCLPGGSVTDVTRGRDSKQCYDSDMKAQVMVTVASSTNLPCPPSTRRKRQQATESRHGPVQERTGREAQTPKRVGIIQSTAPMIDHKGTALSSGAVTRFESHHNPSEETEEESATFHGPRDACFQVHGWVGRLPGRPGVVVIVAYYI